MPVSAGSATFEAIARFDKAISDAKKLRTELTGVKTAGEAGFAGAGAAAGGFGTKMTDAAGKAKKAGTKMSVGLTLPLVLLGAGALKTSTDFETSMAKVGANSNATAAEFDALREKALKLGADTQFSAQQAADAMFELSAAGVSMKDIMGGSIDSVLLLAGATQSSMEESAAVIAQSMNAFGLSAKDTPHVADVMTQAVNQSALSMNDLAEALAHAGQLGATANQDIESVVAGVEALVNQGVPAAQAGTAIAQAMQSLKAPVGKKAAAAIKELGIETRNADGTMKQFPDLVAEIEDGTKNLGKAQRDQALDAIFGVEGMKAMGLALNTTKTIQTDTAAGAKDLADVERGLAQTMGKDAAEAFVKAHMSGKKFVVTGADAIKTLAALNRASDGTAKTFDEKMGKTTARALESFKGSLETLAIRIMEVVLPAMQKLLPHLIKIVNAIAKFAKDHPGIAMMVAGFLGLLAVVGPLLLAFASLVGAITTIAGVFGTIAGAVGLTSAALLGWILVIAAVVVGLVLLYKHSETFRNIVDAVARTVVSLVKGALSWLIEAFPKLVDGIKSVVSWLGEKLGPTVGMVVDYVKEKIADLRVWWDENWTAIQEAAGHVWNMIVLVVRTAIDQLRGFVEAGIGVIQWIWQNFGDKLLAIAATAWQYITSAIDAAIRIVKGVIDTVLALINGDWGKAWHGLLEILSGVWDLIKATVQFAMGIVQSVLEAGGRLLKIAWQAIWDGIKSIASDIWGSIQRAAAAGVNGLIDILNGMISAVNTILGALPGDLKIGMIGHVKWGEEKKPAPATSPMPTREPLRSARGGRVPGTMAGDRVPALLEGGEFVMRKAAVQKYGPQAMESMNALRLAKGGGIWDGLQNAGGAVVDVLRSGAAAAFGPIADRTMGLVNAWAPKGFVGDIGKGMAQKTIDAIREFLKGKDEEMTAQAAADAALKGMGALETGAGSATGIDPSFLRAYQAYQAAIGGVGIESGFRSYEKQAYLYQQYLAGKGNLAARPGHSNHERGLAIDMARHATTSEQQLAAKFGLHFPVRGEPWHVEPISLALLHQLGYRFGGLVGDPKAEKRTGMSLGGLFGPQMMGAVRMPSMADLAGSSSVSSSVNSRVGSTIEQLTINYPKGESSEKGFDRTMRRLVIEGVL